MHHANAYTVSYTCEDARVCNAYVGCMSAVHARANTLIFGRAVSHGVANRILTTLVINLDESRLTDRSIPISITVYLVR